MFYLEMFAEILRIYRATVKFQDFIKSAKTSIGRIIKQGGLINHMRVALLKLFNSHKESFIKFGKSNDCILNKLLQICELHLICNFKFCIYMY